jgi:hypothetical protein
MNRLARRVAAPLVLTALVLAGAAASQVDPPSVSTNLNPGDSYGPITKTVHTPAIPPKPDVLILADTTGSMGDALSALQTGLGSLITAIQTAQPDAQLGVAEYRDNDQSYGCVGDGFAYQLDQQITATTGDVQTAVNGLTASGGCDVPESQLNALTQIAADSPPVGWRTGSSRIVAWFGDSSGHDPSFGATEASTIADLQAANIRVIAVPISTGFGDGLDATGQATNITTATGGSLVNSTDPEDIAAAILSGLQNLPVEVTHSVTCDAGLTASLTPPSQIVTSGDDASFDETITVDVGATQGATLTCTVQFFLDGVSAGEDFVQSISITVNDVTDPSAECVATTNPALKKVPTAGTGAGNSGQNPDGFYEMVFSDNVGIASAVIKDSGSSFSVAVTNGEKDKLTQAPGAKPNAKPGANGLTQKITTKGDPYLEVTDTAGNVTIAYCLVPQPPK